MKLLLSLAFFLVFITAPINVFAADSVLQDDSVDSKMAADRAPTVDTSQVKPNHPKAGIGDGMIVVGHKHHHAHKKLPEAPIIPGPQPGPPVVTPSDVK